mgnify:CR=1 FL=1
MSFHKKQKVTDYRPGDIVFFNFSGKSSASHVGICESWDGTYITTIDGNTGSASEDNGGAVLRRRRHKKFIVGAYRPEYQEDDDMTQDQFDAMMENWMSRQAKKKPHHSGKLKGWKEWLRLALQMGPGPWVCVLDWSCYDGGCK